MFGRKEKPFAKAIPLQQWQDPVEDIAVVFSEGACNIYFFVGDSELIGKLSFDCAVTCRSVCTEVAPYQDRESSLSSYILEIFHSPWPAEVEFGFYTEQARVRIHEKRHFLVKGHDVYHEILCRGFSESYLSTQDSEYSFAQKVLGRQP
jgi:hypothetical protein